MLNNSKINDSDIKVSVCCITFNQEKFLQQALDSILNQKTDFKFEILVHDDASTDDTATILDRYSSRYPEILKVVRPLKNQYSQGRKIFPFLFERAKGKYIAICEGDDYWINDKKLQMQYDYIESNPDCTLLCHSAKFVDMNNKSIGGISLSEKNRKFFLNEVLEKSIGFPTASYFFPTYLVQNIPEYFINAPVEDDPLQLICLSKGYAYYMNEFMSVYRKNVAGSWNERIKKNPEKRLIHYTQKIKMYKEFNKFTCEKYNSSVEEAIAIEELNIVLTNQDYKLLRERKFQTYINRLPFKTKVRLKFMEKFPKTYKLLRDIILSKS